MYWKGTDVPKPELNSLMKYGIITSVTDYSTAANYN